MTRAFSIYLDLVRLAAACLVVMYHASSPFLVNHLLPVSGYGHAAVILFFVLSGYVIAYATDTRKQTVRDYAVSRCSRIWSLAVPAVLLAILFDVVGQTLAPDIYAGHTTNDHTLLRIATSFLFLNEIWSVSIMTFSDTAYWSLNYEVWYYILFGVYLFAGARRRWLWIGLVALMVGPKIVLLSPIWIFGVILYRWQRPQQIPEWLGWLLLAASIGLFTAFEQAQVANHAANALKAYLGEHWLRELNFSRWFISDYLLGVIVFMNFVGMRRVAGLFAPLLYAIERPVRFGAAYTFALYILHQPLLFFFSAVFGSLPPGLMKFGVVLPCVVLTVLVIGYQVERKRSALHLWLVAAVDWVTSHMSPKNFRSKVTRAVEEGVLSGANHMYVEELKGDSVLLADPSME